MSNVPWSVKGVEHEAREAAKLAARKAGLPLGVWLSQTIHATAAQQLKSSSGPTVYATSAASSSAASADGSLGSATARPPALTPEAVLESINRLAGRLAESEARTAEALAPIVEKVAKLSAQIEDGKGGPSRIDVDPLERAMMRMTERLDRIEEVRGAPRPAERQPDPNRRRPGFFSRLFSD
jgi:localization factor PodJL